MFEEVQKWDQEMERSSEKAKKAKLQSVQGTDYEVVGVYDGYPVWKLTSNKSFREESMYMGHCVGQAGGESKVTSVEGGESNYFRNYKQGELLIFSLRDPKEHNQPAVTFELRKVYGERTFEIVQIKGPANRSVSERYRKACRKFIEDKEFVVKEDGKKIGMFLWRNKFYFEDTPEFQKIYHEELIPQQKQAIEDIKSRIYNGVILGGVSLQNIFLTELPDLSMYKVDGPFDCSGNRLTTLKGAPYEATSFNCSGNRLTTLQGAPKRVSKFDCDGNQLTTLEGAPEYIIYSFDCSYNQLKTLKGAPQSVGSSFRCSNNQLKTLEGAPQSVGDSFRCSDNQLKTLKGSPQSVGGGFSCSNNQLKTLEGAPQSVGWDFYCNNNQLTTLEGAPQSIKGDFYCDDNPVKFTEQDKQQAMVNSFNRNRTQPKLESFKQFFQETCWKGYERRGTKIKKKNGKRKKYPIV
jgi:hypothetical protein